MSAIIGIPGPWADQNALAKALAERGVLRLDAGALVDLTSGECTQIDLYNHDPRLRRAFEAASATHPLPAADLDAIEKHKMTVYVLGDPGWDGPAQLFRFAAALLDAGGLGVKVETAGVAHSAARWRELNAALPDPGALLLGFVAMVGGPKDIFSCGMHGFQQPDVIVEDSVENPIEAINHFLLHRFASRPKLKEGEVFAPWADGPRFKLSFEKCAAYPPGDLFFNPFGLWRLSPAKKVALKPRRLDA